MKGIALFVSFIPCAALCIASAQSTKPVFQPGEWQIDSVVTLSTGKQTNSEIMVCANQAGDFWEHQRTSVQCTPPKVTPIPSGYNVKISCAGGAGQVQWKMQSNINETFSSDGTSFQSSGATSTLTTFQGQAPMQAMARIRSVGKRTGPCDAKLKPGSSIPHAGRQD